MAKRKSKSDILGDHAVQFAKNLNLVGDFHGQSWTPTEWQEQIIRRLFGTLDDQGERTVRRCLLMLSRKQGKTFFAAFCCLYSLLCLGPNQQVISAAASQEQAGRVYDTLVEIIQQDDFLMSLCEIIPSKKRIVVASQNSFYAAVACGGKSSHGYNPSVVVLDELEAFTTTKHHDLYAALTTGRARSEPLTILISVQPANRFSLAGEQFDYALKVKNRIENGEVKTDGTIDNPHFLGVLYYAPADADWHDEKLWHKVSPALGDFLSIKEYREQHQYAVEIPSQQINFKQLYLNMPVTDDLKWMDMAKWNACAAKINPDDLINHECFSSLDLAPVNDLSALTLFFPIGDKFQVLPFFWCNKSDIIERSRLEKVPYDVWERQKFITATPGSSTDFATIERDIIALSKKYRIKQLVCDKAHAFQMGQNLAAAGLKVDWFGQGFLSMGPAVARTEKLILDKALQHPANPVLDYCVSNLRCVPDEAGNLKPSNKKRLRHEKIDGAVSLIMSVGVWLGTQCDIKKPSIYESRGITVI